MKKSIYLVGILSLFIPSTALAHNIGGSGFLSGLSHPLLGLDHLLAMIAVGIISTQIKRKAIWKVPAAFVIFMIIGGALALSGLYLPAVESSIALSVLLLGIIIVLSQKIPTKWTMFFVAFFAIFHGHAHGTEMPLIANSMLYALGMILSTSFLHFSGVLIGYYAKKTTITSKLLQFAGAGVSFTGLLILLSVI